MLSMLKAGQSSVTWSVTIAPGTPQSQSIKLTFDSTGMATGNGSQGPAPLTYIVASSLVPGYPLAFYAAPVPMTPPLPYSGTYWGVCNAIPGAGFGWFSSDDGGKPVPFTMSLDS